MAILKVIVCFISLMYFFLVGHRGDYSAKDLEGIKCRLEEGLEEGLEEVFGEGSGGSEELEESIEEEDYVRKSISEVHK